MLYVNSRIRIPLTEIEFTYARSGGPGGQNVNKVNSKAIMRWQVLASPSLPWDVRARFLERYGSRLTVEGDLIITSQKYRDQPSNTDDCLEKLRELLLSIAVAPVARRPTRPTLASKVRRVEGKRDTAKKKQSRKSPDMDY